MLYVVHALLELIFMLICVVTNPIVCLFANEVGQLPAVFKLWQTHDNPLDIEWMVTDDGCVPDCFKYDFKRHYIYHYENTTNGVLTPGYVELIDPTFTLTERLKRYGCRLSWLYRNCNYGFSYYINGRDYNGKDNVIVRSSGIKTNNELWISYIKGGNILTATWSLCLVHQYCKWFCIRIYIGWKLVNCTEPYDTRAMLAFHFNPFHLVAGRIP